MQEDAETVDVGRRSPSGEKSTAATMPMSVEGREAERKRRRRSCRWLGERARRETAELVSWLREPNSRQCYSRRSKHERSNEERDANARRRDPTQHSSVAPRTQTYMVGYTITESPGSGYVLIHTEIESPLLTPNLVQSPSPIQPR